MWNLKLSIEVTITKEIENEITDDMIDERDGSPIESWTRGERTGSILEVLPRRRRVFTKFTSEFKCHNHKNV